MRPILLYNCGQLISMAPLVESKRFTAIQFQDLGILEDAWVALQDGVIQALGTGEIPSQYERWTRVDAQGKLVTPGLIDCHSHPIFGGDRTQDFAKRLEGLTYQEIAAQSGGIRYSIQATRQSEDQQLLQMTLKRIYKNLRQGVTTQEAKTGYGQSVAEELRLVKILRLAASLSPAHLEVTCLALHDIPAGIEKRDFIDAMRDQLLPILAETRLADWVDAFVEEGYFSVADCESFMQKAKSLGLAIRVHADEFQDSGAAYAAARWGAASADHVQQASDTGITAMAEAGTVAVLLPGTSFYSKIPFAKAARYRDKACAMAVASDFNPGSCYLPNLSFAASLAALYCGMSSAEAMVAITWNAARALRLEHKKGAIYPGYDADLVVHTAQTLEQWIAEFGQNLPVEVLARGKRLT